VSSRSPRFGDRATRAGSPERGLLEIVARTAHQIGWTRHFGPVSGSDPKLPDALGRYVTTAFCYGTYLGPAKLARHMPRQVTARELARAFHQHAARTGCGPRTPM
jgi:hypothetical protein